MRKKLSIIAGVLLLVGLVGYLVHKRQAKDAVEFAPVLKENEREKVVIDTRAGTIKTVVRGDSTHVVRGGRGQEGQGAGGQIVTDISGVRKAAVTIDNDGNVEVYAPTKGVIFEPGLSAFYSDDKFRLGVDVQFFYWRRFGINAGIGITTERPFSAKAFVAGSYNVWSNTSLFIGITQSKEFAVGARIRF